MKIIGFLVLALIANVIADDEEVIQTVATNFETDSQTIKTCVEEAGLTVEDIHIAEGKWRKITRYEDLDAQTKESPAIQGRFVACVLEKKNVMKDSKLVVEKILEGIGEKENEANKKVITKCLSSLNEDDELTREDRALGLPLCAKGNDTNVGEKIKNGKKH